MGYQPPQLVFAVEQIGAEDQPIAQLAAFFEEDDARRCRAQLAGEGRSNLAINMIAVHGRVSDWQNDR